jgi:hypothetical protein
VREERGGIVDFVTLEEVKRACTELGLRDWSQLEDDSVLDEEAAILREQVGGEALQIPLASFRRGLEVELEHGLAFPDANVTNNHPVLTAKIVLAHLKEMLDYYERLDVAELEGDMFKALLQGDTAKLAAKYDKLLAARRHLNEREAERREATA